MLVAKDNISSPDKLGIAAPSSGSIVIDIVPPVKTTATFFLIDINAPPSVSKIITFNIL